MRRLIIWGAFLLLLGGCASPQPVPISPLAGRSGFYETQVTVHTQALIIEAAVTQTPEACRVVFTAPDTLAGMEYRFDSDSVDLTYRGLAFQYDPQAVPKNSVAGILSTAVGRAMTDESVRIEETDEGVVLSGMLDAGDYTMLVSPETSTPHKLLLPDVDMEIEFVNFRFLN